MPSKSARASEHLAASSATNVGGLVRSVLVVVLGELDLFDFENRRVHCDCYMVSEKFTSQRGLRREPEDTVLFK